MTVSKNYGIDVFGEKAIKKYLKPTVAKKLLATMSEGRPLDPSIADEVASGMQAWALDNGATHFTHWFQPLTGGTAEKHDAFLNPFKGKNLIGGETDASSFPSGGLRSTFEARGYTAWDPTSPAFIKRHENGATLCIPTAFCAYTGAALDTKTPLLRSEQAVKRATERLMKMFKQPKAKIEITLGAEQEYFLIDKEYYLRRPDLLQTGRTVFGAAPAKHQQLDDHYFGAIRSRILKFMTEVEHRLWALGIPAMTRHNEVAPAQFELAPIFEDLNLAVDHNMMIMETLKRTAEEMGLVCLLHEKPFDGVNGSGKHCNWSLAYGGKNLLSPGDNPRDNAIFLTFLSAIIRAIDLHADMLRTTTAGAGNDHRLGANEAPPAIISIFLGDELSAVMKSIELGEHGKVKGKSTMRLGVDSLPNLPKDSTDRNRTSPFAFTGNKFEFRAPGSSQNCAQSMMVLNTIVAESIDAICDKLEAMDGDFNVNLQALLQRLIKKHKRVLFSGDGYGKEWPEEAKKRGLPNLKNTIEAIEPLKNKDNRALFAKYGVLSETEMESRYEIAAEDYERRVRIEGEVALEIGRTMILPVVRDELVKARSAEVKPLILKLKAGMEDLYLKCEKVEKALKKGGTSQILTEMANLRKTVDKLEHIVDDNKWPLPKYREMLFIY